MTDAAHPWGRVDADGNVYVTEGDAERLIGQWPGGDPVEAMSLYTRRFDDLATEVTLLETRLTSGALAPDDAAKALDVVRGKLKDAQAIGDLASLGTRLDALEPAIAEHREKRRIEKEQRGAQARDAKTRIADEAETIAANDDWRRGADRLRELLDEWKQIPRLNKSADDELWHRFSTARTTYTKRRKAHFAELNTVREEAQKAKEKLIAEAEELSTSTEWGATSIAYRDLMQRWKRAGSAPRNVEDKLWKRFRAAQDVFFNARDAANAAEDEEFKANAEVKAQILTEAEALLPIKDVEATRKVWHELVDRWEAAGKVPREQVKEFEGRLRTVERAIRDAGDMEWKRTDPEKSARADDMISKLEQAITETEQKLAKAEAAGDEKKAAKLRDNLESRRSFLEIAKKTASDFS